MTVMILPGFLLVIATCIHGSPAALSKPVIFQLGMAFLQRPFALHCSVQSSDASRLVYIWYKDNAEIQVQRSPLLEFSSLSEADRGLYTCQTSEENPQTASATSDPVAVFPSDAPDNLPAAVQQLERRQKRSGMVPMPTIFQQGVPITGRPFTLECVVLEGYGINSRTRYTWYKDHVQIEGQSGILLRFASLKEEDVGEYVCTAREGPVESTSPPSKTYHLNALIPPVVHMEPTSPNSVVKGILGKELTLTCNVTKGIPPVPDDGYGWSYLPSSIAMSRPLVGNARTLTLGPLTRKDNGQYFCTASSGQYFKDPLDLNGHASVMVDIVYLENISLISPEEIDEGDHVTLTCEVDSHPPARLVWIVNGREVRHVTDNLDHYVILHASCSDSATYTCGASNADLPGLVRNATVQLRVPCKEDIAEDRTTQTPANETPGHTDQDKKIDLRTAIIVVAVLLVLMYAAICFLIVMTPLPLSFSLQDAKRPGRCTACLESLGRTLRRQIPRSPDSKKHDGGDMELGNTTSGEPLLRNFSKSRLQRRKAKRQKGFEVGLKPKFQRAKLALLQGQKVQFDKAYKKGIVYVFPPLAQHQTQQQARQDDVITVEDDEENVEEESKACVVKLLYEELQKVARPEDPPAFVFTQATSDCMSVIIYHFAKGVVIVHVDGTTDPEASTPIEKAKKLLEELEYETSKELRGFLVPSAITLLLALPNVTNVRNSRLDIQTPEDKRDVQILYGRMAADYKAWVQQIPVYANAWGSDTDKHQSFIMAVSRHLSVKCFRDSRTWTEPSPEAPSGWLVTPEQAGILHRADRLLHLYGPPGSGKTMLLVDRARQWLREGSHVIMAVGGSRLELLLDSLGRWALHGMPSEKVHKLMLCRDAEEFKKAVRDQREQKQPEDICVVLDEASSDFLASALDVLKSNDVSCLWTARHTDLTDQETQRFQELKGQSVFLEHSVRCPRDVVDSAILLQYGLPPPRMAVHPAVQDLPTPPVQAVLHASHASDAILGPPPSRSSHLGSLVRQLFGLVLPTFACYDCENWLRSSMLLLVNGLSLTDEQWRRWVILLTGDWGADNALTGRLVDWLRRHGIPAVLEWQPDNETSNLPLCNLLGLERDMRSSTKYRRTATRARVASGEDDEGRPAVHVIHASHCKGLDRPCVLAVHYDWRDDHPDHQSQARRESRLSQHREQLFRAVTRCQQELCVCFLSPSPAAPLFPQLHPTAEDRSDSLVTPV